MKLTSAFSNVISRTNGMHLSVIHCLLKIDKNVYKLNQYLITKGLIKSKDQLEVVILFHVSFE